jgi:four helix bundle protein
MAKSFEELIVWQEAEIITLHIYSLFKTNKDFGFRDQIQRASISIMNNIAE